ncbi:MAG: type I-E CRISPR-associated protein Cas5/CasD [Verrucomicrobiota bacterium]|jgi:CRISPR system Cascade subunit CasD
MLSNAWLALLLDGPMQSWGHSSRFDRRTTALHPTRSGIIGILAAALGINKYGPDEGEKLARFAPLRITTVSLPRRDHRGNERFFRRMEDYHTVTGIRRASGTVDADATVQTYRHYLLDARFGVLIEGPVTLLEEIAAALRNPRWGVWLGRKCCPPASPLLIALVSTREEAWRMMLVRSDHAGDESLEQFDHVIEVAPSESGADSIEDAPVGFGKPIGERHAPRWIRRVPGSTAGSPKS